MQARTLLGLSCYGAKRFLEAAKYLEPAAGADPANAELHQVLAQSCLLAKKYPCAQEQFRQLLEQNPDSAPAHMLLGQALDGLQRIPEAIAEFEAAAKVAPQEPSVHFGLGYLHWKLRQYDEAKADFERELANDPNHAQALAYLGDIELKRNNPEDALVLLRKAVQLRSDLRHSVYRYWGDSCAAESSIRRRLPPCCKPRNSIPCNPMLIFAWDGCTRQWETLWLPRRSFPNFENFMKKRTMTSLLKCPPLPPLCRNKTISLIRQRQKVTAKSGWYEARFQRSVATWSPALMCGGDRSHGRPEHRYGVRPEPWHS